MNLYSFPKRSLNETEVESTISLEERLKQVYQQGLAEGQAQGFELGQQQLLRESAEQQAADKAEAIRQAKEETSRELIGEFQSQLDTIKSAIDELNQFQWNSLQKTVSALVEEMARAVINTELSIQPSHLLKTTEALLESLQTQDKITAIQVSTHDWEIWKSVGLDSIGGIPIEEGSGSHQGEVRFVGAEQLHVLNFQARLDELMGELQLSLTGS